MQSEKEPQTPAPFNVIVFASGSGTNLGALLKDPNAPFRIIAVCTDRQCRALEVAQKHNIPTIYHSWKRYFATYPHRERNDYDLEFLEKIREQNLQPDLIVLAGYMRLLSGAFLAATPCAVINVHPADLIPKDPSGKRRYIGIDAVNAAIKAGEKRTRSSVILVTEGEDEGPLLVSGPWVDVDPAAPIQCHQDKQKQASDWPALTTAVTLIALKRLTWNSSGQVLLDGAPLDEAGYCMEQEREQCAESLEPSGKTSP